MTDNLERAAGVVIFDAALKVPQSELPISRVVQAWRVWRAHHDIEQALVADVLSGGLSRELIAALDNLSAIWVDTGPVSVPKDPRPWEHDG